MADETSDDDLMHDPGADDNGDADPRVPDATAWPDRDLGFLGDDVYLGEEAGVPADYADLDPSSRPSLSGSFEIPADERAELRELERRLEQHRTPAFPIDLRRRLPLEGVWRRWRALAMWGRSDVVDDFGRDPRATARWEWLFEFLYTRWFRVQASGIDHIPATGRALLVANHAGSLPYDSAMVMHAVRRDHPARRDVRPLVEDTVFHLPFLGPLMNRIGGVRADPENAERLLRKDELVAVFPEGEKGMGKLWKDRYRLQRFGRGGFVKLALRTSSPIIPVAVVGAEEAAPMLGKVTWFAKNIGIPWIPVTPTFPWLGPAGLLPLPSKWFVAFGEPIDLAKLGPAAAEDRLLVNRLADQIRSQIQTMIDGLLQRRRSPVLSAFLG
ncbi:MAG: acyltransferase family protein [Deltaproteobacteria bacterium]|nr:acyltransferase family protein [Deltaproteobacteria bacterium]MCW5806259.1 acyltransferase family protein [Deltaproteobacteria bacterium]